MSTGTDTDAPLEDAEFEQLERFLAGRAAALANLDEDTDPGVLDLGELDGFLTGVVSGPELLMPPTWMAGLWGDVPHEWASEEEFDAIFTLLVRHMNMRARQLATSPARFEPLFGEAEIDGETQILVDEWCSGYARAVSLTVEAWEAGGSTVADMLFPIFTFGLPDGWDALARMGPDEEMRLMGEVAPAVRELHGYWMRRRMPGGAGQAGDAPTVGRNALCPCGSGSKYKHCCLKRLS